MKQDRLQFLLDISLPEGKISEAIQSGNLADAVEWLNQLKLRFPGLVATLSAPGSSSPSGPSHFDAKNGSQNGTPDAKHAIKLLSATDAALESNDLEQLTSRQKDIVNLLFKGYSYREIGRSLGITLPTVRAHLHSAYKRLRVKSRAQAVAKVFRQTPGSPMRRLGKNQG